MLRVLLFLSSVTTIFFGHSAVADPSASVRPNLTEQAKRDTPESDIDALYQTAAVLANSGVRWQANAALDHHVLRPYLDYFRFARNVKLADTAELTAWLKHYQDEIPLAANLRHKLLSFYAGSLQWAEFVRHYRPIEATPEERCQVWAARMALQPKAEVATRHALILYRDAMTPPVACTPAFTFLRTTDAINTDDAERRFAALIAGRQIASAKSTLQDLPKGRQQYAAAAILAEQDAYLTLRQAQAWSADDRALTSVTIRALERIAAVNPVGAKAKLQSFINTHQLDEAAQLRVRSAITRTAIIANLADSGAWLDALPSSARDSQTHEWGVRRALTAMNPELALTRVEAMPEKINGVDLGGSARWRYVRGRLLQWLGRDSDAQVQFNLASTDATFFGFLASDRLDAGYALCPLDIKFTPKISGELLGSGALKRISAFKRLGDRVSAKREWMFLLGKLDPNERRQAGLLASMEGWGEYAILALNAPADRQIYQARFPLLQADVLTTQASVNQLDSAFVAGLIRQESAWDPSAVSRANAIGLMQMLPGTAALTARSVGFTSKINLTDPATNLTLGTAHLRLLSEKYAGSPILMTAAYNAGPSAVAKWQDGLYQRFPDLWIETIPYKETREYVTAVLAFSVIYDWRLDGKLQRLSARVPEFPQIDSPALTACPTPIINSAETTAIKR
jgi:soluble lytic murein transglycosylase